MLGQIIPVTLIGYYLNLLNVEIRAVLLEFVMYFTPAMFDLDICRISDKKKEYC